MRLVVATFAVPLFPVLMWWLTTRSALYFRGWVNVEYILLLSLALVFPSYQMIALLTAELTISLIEPIAHLYYFSLKDVILSLKYLLLLPTQTLAAYSCLVAVYIVVCGVSLRCLIREHARSFAIKAAWILLGGAVLACSYDVAMRRSSSAGQVLPSLGNRDMPVVHIVRAPGLTLLRGITGKLADYREGATRVLPSVLTRALEYPQLRTQPNVVLIVVESWGLAYEEKLNQMQLATYLAPAVRTRYSVETGTVQFLGATIAGETRELCGDSRGVKSLHQSANSFRSCWPARFDSLGYSTLAVHGFTPGMFSRKDWYQALGFAESIFLPDLERDGARMCDGFFPGACDEDVAIWIRNRLLGAGDRPTFVHWVTLNSHLPLRVDPQAIQSAGCAALKIDKDGSLCTWFSRIQLVHESVGRLAVTADLKPTIFVVVGDHSPPFLSISNRNRFSQSMVPYVILRPKATREASRPMVTSKDPLIRAPSK